MKKADILIIAVVALCALGLILFYCVGSGAQKKSVVVTHAGETVRVLPLDEDTILVLSFPEGSNTLEISSGAVRITEADCGGDCVRCGKIENAGSSIVCLPHRLSITITGDGPDGVSR